MVKTLHSQCRRQRSDPGQGTKIPYATWPKSKTQINLKNAPNSGSEALGKTVKKRQVVKKKTLGIAEGTSLSKCLTWMLALIWS